jgi:peptide deformylase
MLDNLNLVYYPHPCLRRVSKTIKKFDLVQTVADRMFEIMKEKSGLGLAANQIGLPWRMFVMNINNKSMVFVNPMLTFDNKRIVSMKEGCLSVPNIYLTIERPQSVYVEAVDVTGKPFKASYSGTYSRCIQHEVDHLNGKMFFDKSISLVNFPAVHYSITEQHFLELERLVNDDIG